MDIDTPKPPDPQSTINAQTQANVTNQNANALLQTGTTTDAQGNSVTVSPGNRIFVSDPEGSLWQGPTAARNPRGDDEDRAAYRARMRAEGNTSGFNVTPLNTTTTLSPINQDILDAQQSGQRTLARAFDEEAGDVRDLLRQDTDYTAGLGAYKDLSFAGMRPYRTTSRENLPARGTLNSNGLMSGNFAARNPTSTLSDAGLGGGDYADRDFSDIRRSTIKALRSRQDEDFARDRQSMEADLRAKGVAQGSEAWRRAFDDFGETVNDARLQADLAGTADARNAYDQYLRQQDSLEGQRSRRFGERQAMSADQSNAFNQFLTQQGAIEGQRGQRFAERGAVNADRDMDRAALLGERRADTAEGNQIAQLLRADRAAQVNSLNANRAAEAAEARDLQTLPFNQITALLSGSQITPTPIAAPNAPYSPLSNVDAAGIIQNSYAQRLAGSNARNQIMGDLYGGLLGGAGSIVGGGLAGGYF